MKTRWLVAAVLSVVLLISIAPSSVASVLQSPAMPPPSRGLDGLEIPARGIASSTPLESAFASSSIVPCVSPGSIFFYEGFDSVVAPGLPAGWTSSTVNGTQGVWRTNPGTVHPLGGAANSPPNLVFFNSWTALAGQTARLYRTTPLDLHRFKVVYICFHMYRDSELSGTDDFVQVQVSTNGGSSWTSVGTPFTRYNTIQGWWHMATCMTDEAAGRLSVNIGFLGTSKWGNDIYLDDVAIVVVPAIYLPLMFR